MRRLNADCVMFRSPADREKFDVFARLTKSSSHLSSMFHPGLTCLVGRVRTPHIEHRLEAATTPTARAALSRD
jgi:hypothetical protein